MNNHPHEDLALLLAAGQSPRISIALTTDPTTPQAQVRYRNLLRAAEMRAQTADVSALLIARARALADDATLWQRPGQALAVYIDAQVELTYRLPYPVAERAHIGPDFLLTPLIPLLAAGQPYAILALSQGAVRLLRCTRDNVSEVPLPASVPTSLQAALLHDEYERERRFSPVPSATGRQRGAIYYSHGIGSDEREGELQRYCQRIDKGLHEVLNPATTPLLLAGVEELMGIFRSVASYPRVMAQGITGSPDLLRAAELQERAAPLIAELENREREAVIARYRALIGTGRASADPGEIVTAAAEGRVDTLIVASELAAMSMPHRVVVPGEELANHALLGTLRNGGAVIESVPGGLPDNRDFAAIFRY